MKTLKLLSVFIMLYMVSNFYPVKAQDFQQGYKNELLLGAFQLFNNSFYGSYERYYGNWGTSFTTAFTFRDSYDESKTGILFQVSQKFYFNDVTADYGNFYFSPGLKYKYVEITGHNFTDRITTYGFQIVGGVKYDVLERFVIDFYFGGKMDYSVIEQSGSEPGKYGNNYFSLGFTGVSPVINCTFGFRF